MKYTRDNFHIDDVVKVSKLCVITNDDQGNPINPIEYWDADAGDDARVISDELHMETNSNLLNQECWREVEFINGRKKGKKRVFNQRRLFKPVNTENAL